MVSAEFSLEYRTDQNINRRSSLTAIWYRDKVLDHILKLYVTEFGLSLVLMDSNACPHRAVIVGILLEGEGIGRMQ